MSRHSIDLSEELEKIAEEKELDSVDELAIDNVHLNGETLVIDAVEARFRDEL